LVLATGVETVPVQAGAPAQSGNSTPVAVTLLILGSTLAAGSILTGTLIVMVPGTATPAAIEQPFKLLPPVVTVPGQVIKTPEPVAVGVPANVIPAGNVSVKLIGAVVLLPVRAIAMV
jgi:hypothetical protein